MVEQGDRALETKMKLLGFVEVKVTPCWIVDGCHCWNLPDVVQRGGT